MRKKISIIIPVYNESWTIKELLDRVFRVDLGQWEREVIVVDDGSLDATPRLLAEAKRVLDFKLLRHPHNRGKGASVRSGLLVATGQAVLIQDADLEYDPEDIPKFLSLFESGSLIVFGSRMMRGTQGGYFHYILGAKLLTFFINILFGAKLTDPYTCYKLVDATIFRKLNLEAKGFELEAEVVAKLLMLGHDIVETPITYKPRKFVDGKKIRGRDAYRGLITVFKIWHGRTK